ncbi:NAD(P)-dependent oxidoreductase [Gordonia sp. OPL2]|uniref:NAD-dependent epimerase/dehydratase family protein n=1 Tax=Gordonia sp. OPL2 TaxID=2486274 RepID=UPI0016564A4C|nr:NAD(P)-dependent oxidoreductase [Gordonia sp. OPL2]ROZ89216.1 NAD(P)-dependent oxidoreductase [Gordonia sp. OPL2]
MKVFVTGGTGAIGGYAVPALVAAGHTVTALTRTPQKSAVVRQQGARPAEVSLFDRSQLREAFRGHDAVINLASALPSAERFMLTSAWRECQRIRTEGSAAVVDAALDAEVPRVVQESVVMICRDNGDDWVDEDSPVDRFPLAVGNHAAEANNHRFSTQHGTGVVLRFGIFYGPGAAHSEQIMRMARHHIGFRAGRPDAYVSSIHLADAAAAVVAALDCPTGTYHIVDDEPVTKRDDARSMAAAVGRRSWVSGPGRVAALLGNRTTSMTRSLRVRNNLFRSTTGWAPRYPSVREGYAQMAAVLASRTSSTASG